MRLCAVLVPTPGSWQHEVFLLRGGERCLPDPVAARPLTALTASRLLGVGDSAPLIVGSVMLAMFVPLHIAVRCATPQPTYSLFIGL